MKVKSGYDYSLSYLTHQVDSVYQLRLGEGLELEF